MQGLCWQILHLQQVESPSEEATAHIRQGKERIAVKGRGEWLKVLRFGVGQILVGVLAAPFSAGTSTALILSGTAMVVDAASDALNNKENWERELNDRQRMNPDVQRNSIYSPSNFTPKLEVV